MKYREIAGVKNTLPDRVDICSLRNTQLPPAKYKNIAREPFPRAVNEFPMPIFPPLESLSSSLWLFLRRWRFIASQFCQTSLSRRAKRRARWLSQDSLLGWLAHHFWFCQPSALVMVRLGEKSHHGERERGNQSEPIEVSAQQKPFFIMAKIFCNSVTIQRTYIRIQVWKKQIRPINVSERPTVGIAK